MEVRGTEYVVIYLTDWQIRMIEDFLHVTCHHWTVPVEPGGGLVKYRGPSISAEELRPEMKRLYFTDWQQREIKDATGEDCQFIELYEGSIPEYMGTPLAQIGRSLAR